MEYFETRHGVFYLGDARELIKRVPSESVDIIITDPPYGLGLDDYDNPEVLFEIEDDLFRVLKPNSYLVMYYSIKYLPEVFRKLRKFKYEWLLPVIELSVRKNSMTRLGVNQYSAIVIFSKGKPKPKIRTVDFLFVIDQLPVVDRDVVKRLQEARATRQFKNTTTIAMLLRRFTDKGETVLDPFAGFGSIPLVCELFKRKWIAFEIDSKKYVFAKKLLSVIGTP